MKHFNHSRLLVALVATFALFVTACDDHDHDHENHEGESLDEIIAEACLHFASGPMTAITAGADAATATVAASTEHMRLDVTLLAKATGGFEGVIAVDLDEAAEVIVVSSQGATLRVSTDSFQTDLEFEAVTYAKTCDGDLQAFDGVVGRHLIEITSDTELVSIVLEAAGDAHDH